MTILNFNLPEIKHYILVTIYGDHSRMDLRFGVKDMCTSAAFSFISFLNPVASSQLIGLALIKDLWEL